MKNKIIYITIILLGAILLKEFAKFLSVEELQFLLYPIQKSVYLFTGISFEYIENEGYVSSVNAIIIDESCSGISFFIISFSLCLILCFKKRNFMQWFKYAFFALIISYFITIIVNSFRIILSIKLIPFEEHFQLLSTATFHQIFGGIIYLFSLLIFYYFLSQKLKTT